MAFVIRVYKGVRNHWKKSLFATVTGSYLVLIGKEKYDTHQLMRAYCEEVVKYGDQNISAFKSPRSITVILNPNANKRKSKAHFEKFCEPLLHLAGISVDIIQTESEGHAKTIIEKIGKTDAIVIAGGDGTVSEVITGLFRRCGSNQEVPVGILPLGTTNTVGQSLFPGGEYLKNVSSLADATLAIIKQNKKPIDVMKIEVIPEDIAPADTKEKTSNKPVYAIGTIEWGAFRDVEALRDKYWYFGGLRDYATYVFNGLRINLDSNCKAVINYKTPCSGCSCCNPKMKTWGQYLTFGYFQKPHDCGELCQKEISATNLILSTANQNNSSINIPHLSVNLGPERLGYFEFVKKGFNKEVASSEVVEAKKIEIRPSTELKKNSENWISIDKENFELKPINVTLLPKAINVFCNEVVEN